MREKNFALKKRSLHLRVWTLKDKKSMFRASQPDDHIVELTSVVPGMSTGILREWHFAEPEKALQHFEWLKGALK